MGSIRPQPRCPARPAGLGHRRVAHHDDSMVSEVLKGVASAHIVWKRVECDHIIAFWVTAVVTGDQVGSVQQNARRARIDARIELALVLRSITQGHAVDVEQHRGSVMLARQPRRGGEKLRRRAEMSRLSALTRSGVAVPCVALTVGVVPTGAVVGGVEDTSNIYANVGNWQLQLDDEWFGLCTGTLVAENVVLTAAHCVDFFGVQGGLPVEDLRITFDPTRTPPPRTTPSTTSSFIPTGRTVLCSEATRSASAWPPGGRHCPSLANDRCDRDRSGDPSRPRWVPGHARSHKRDIHRGGLRASGIRHR